MNLELFFEKFNLITALPDACTELRLLIVRYGINGKLVPNDPGEIAVRPSVESSGFNIGRHANWRTATLGDVFTLEYGENLPAPKRSQTGEYPVYGSNGIVGTHNAFLTEQPSIIIGRKGSAGALNIANGPSWTTDVAYFVCPPPDVDLRFTYYLFSTLDLENLGKGIKPGLSRKEAYSLPISLPPLSEQKRIVSKVDELLALMDVLESQLRDADRIGKTLLGTAISELSNS
jgi:type I restriction enzyme S subunit